MRSRENKVIAVYLVATVLLLYLLLEYTSPPAWVNSAVLLGVGVIAPLLTNEYLDRQQA